MGIKRAYDVMYVCVGKHTSLENDRYVCLLLVCMYVWETYIPRKLEVCMYVKGMYVCLGKQTYLQKIIGMYICLGERTYLETRGMCVC